MIKQPGEELGNNDICVETDGTISYKVWIKTGGGLINRDCLTPKDPNHIYNVIISHGLDPNHYGLEHPLTSEFSNWSRDRLVNEIIQLRDTLDCAARHGFL